MVAPSSFWISSLFLEQTFKGARPPPTLLQCADAGTVKSIKAICLHRIRIRIQIRIRPVSIKLVSCCFLRNRFRDVFIQLQNNFGG